MIAVEGVQYRQAGFALELSLSVEAGQRLALIGASGAGKSTLLSLVAGFLRPDVGRIQIGGKDVTDLPVAARPVSILFQDSNLFPHLSAFDNVALGLRPDLRLSEADRAAVDRSLERVGLGAMGARLPGALSGGQAARVALARMLLRDRPVALLDEPFAALDPGLRREMAGLVTELCAEQGTTLVLVAHELRGLDGLATDLCLLEAGQVRLHGRYGALQAEDPAELAPWL